MLLPTKPGDTTAIETADTTLTVEMNHDGTYNIYIDGTLYKASVTAEFVMSFVVAMKAEYGAEIDLTDDSTPSP